MKGRDKTTAVTFRLPTELLANLREGAARDGRSLNNYVVHVLRTALKPPETGASIFDGTPMGIAINRLLAAARNAEERKGRRIQAAAQRRAVRRLRPYVEGRKQWPT